MVWRVGTATHGFQIPMRKNNQTYSPGEIKLKIRSSIERHAYPYGAQEEREFQQQEDTRRERASQRNLDLCSW